jgi:azurin
MKIRFPLLPIFAALALAGCGQKEPAPSTGAAAAAAPAPAAGPRVIEITANDQMKYSLTAIEAKPGEQIKVVLTNTGTLPKEAMGHNWVLLKADADVAAFASAAALAKEHDYIPAALKDQMLAHIELLGPRKSGEWSSPRRRPPASIPSCAPSPPTSKSA